MQPLALPVLASCLAALPAGGTGDLLVAPTRVVLEGAQRSAAVTLVNTGAQPALYRVGLDHVRMLEDGRTVPIDVPAPGEQFADDLVRFSPRQVLLEPGATQVVRIVVRKPGGLAEGEYRSHLTFRAVPATLEPDAEPPPGGGTRIVLRAVYGVSVPLIVRHGRTEASLDVRAVRVVRPTDGAPAALQVVLERAGNRSTYGDVTVALPSPRGEPKVLGAVRGVAVWTPNASRSLLVPLPGWTPSAGDLVVTHEPRDGGPTAQATLPIR